MFKERVARVIVTESSLKGVREFKLCKMRGRISGVRTGRARVGVGFLCMINKIRRGTILKTQFFNLLTRRKRWE